jgi:protein O-GlcNAc transferase
LRGALQLNKSDPRLLVQLAAVLASTGRFEEAEPLARNACALAPQHPQPPYTHGMILRSLDRFNEADATLSRSIDLDPSNGGSWLARGVARIDLRNLDAAIADFDEALRRLPESFEAHAYKSNALRQLSRFAEALHEIDAALALRPMSAEGRRARAMLLGALRRHSESVPEIERAIDITPADPDNWAAKGDLCARASRDTEAIAAFERALSLAPARLDIEEHLITVRRAACDWRAFDHDAARIVALARDPKYPIRPFNLLIFDTSSADQMQAARKYARTYAPPLTGPLPSFPPARTDARIRLAYLSSDFRNHAMSLLLVGVIEHHNRGKFAVTAISTGRNDGSALRGRIQAAFDQFVGAEHWSDDRIVAYVRDQRIDILIDLNGLAGDARGGVLARRAAPIQVAYLGYPGTTGDPNVDYMIADRIVIPPSDRDNFSERIVYLPDSYYPNDDRRMIADFSPPREDLGLPEDAFVYCCFNTAVKLTPATFDRWMRILAATPSSVLWLIEYNKFAGANLRREAEKRGISPGRIVFAPFAEQADHLARLRRADLFLDTTPYNAHTTACDALWAGVPILTCPGATFAGRVAASLLHAAGLSELVVATPELYEATAIALARDRKRLDGIRRNLLETIRTTPLFDTQRFTRDLEFAFVAMHARRVANGAPVDIDLAR